MGYYFREMWRFLVVILKGERDVGLFKGDACLFLLLWIRLDLELRVDGGFLYFFNSIFIGC